MPRIFAVTLLAAGLSVALPAAAADTDAKLRAAIDSLVPNASIDSIAESAVAGLYEVVVNGQVVYLSQDGRFLIQGSLYDIGDKRDLTELTRAKLRVAGLKEAGPERRIIFAPDKPKYAVTVFTDIDCGYCRKLHQEMADYNALGIAVEYLFFPRAGVGSESYDKAVTVWCSDDRKQAMTQAKAGEALDKKECPNPIEADYQLGARMGISGTPAVFTSEGVQLGGYVPPQQLLQRLQQQEAVEKAPGT